MSDCTSMPCPVARVCNSTLPVALMGPVTWSAPLLRTSTRAPDASASSTGAAATTSTALLPLPWLPVMTRSSRSVMNTPPLPLLDSARLSTSVRRCCVPVPMPVAARNVAAALRTIRLSLLARPSLSLRLPTSTWLMAPPVASSKAPPSASTRLSSRFRPANRLTAPWPLLPTASTAVPLDCSTSFEAPISMKPSVTTLAPNNASPPKASISIRPLLLFSCAVCTTSAAA